jgi:ferritin-like metal-binding protein YciE
VNYLKSLEALYIKTLRDLFDAERAMAEIIPSIAEAASHEKLTEVVAEHKETNQKHMERIEQLFNNRNLAIRGEPCAPVRGVLQEAAEIVETDGEADENVRDVALVGSLHAMGHYKLARYGAACSYAYLLEHDDEAALLKQTLEETRDGNEKLTRLAEGGWFGRGLYKRVKE